MSKQPSLDPCLHLTFANLSLFKQDAELHLSIHSPPCTINLITSFPTYVLYCMNNLFLIPLRNIYFRSNYVSFISRLILLFQTLYVKLSLSDAQSD